MLPVVVFLVERIHDGFQMQFIVDEIGLGSIYKQRFDVVLFDVLGVGFLQGEEIIVGDVLLVTAVAFADVFLQFVDRRMQIDQDLWLYDLGIDDVEQFLIQPELLTPQSHFGKQQRFGEQVICDGDLLEQVFRLQHLLELLVAFGHKKQLERKGILIGVFVEFGQEGIVGKFFQNQSGIEMFAQQIGQRGFAGADVSFYRNKIVFHASRCKIRGNRWGAIKTFSHPRYRYIPAAIGGWFCARWDAGDLAPTRSWAPTQTFAPQFGDVVPADGEGR